MRYALAHNQFSEDYALRRILNVKFVNRLFFRSEISLFSTLFFYFTLLLTRCTSRRWSHQNTLALGSCCCFFTIWLSKFLRPCVSFWHLSSLLCHSTQWIMKQLICCFLFYSQLWCKSCSTHVQFGDRSIYLKVNNSYFIHLHHLLGDHHSPATTNTHVSSKLLWPIIESLRTHRERKKATNIYRRAKEVEKKCGHPRLS